MVLQLNVLRSGVKDRVAHHQDGGLAVTKERRRLLFLESDLLHQITPPRDFLAGVPRYVVFQFGGRLCDWFFKMAGLRDQTSIQQEY